MSTRDIEEVGTIELQRASELMEHNANMKDCVEELRDNDKEAHS